MISFFSLSLVVIGVLTGSLGIALIKKGTSLFSFRQLFFRRIFWEGVVLFGISLLLYVVVLQKEDLSAVYPLGSMSYLVTTLISIKYFGEKMNAWKWAALAGVIAGVTLIAVGS